MHSGTILGKRAFATHARRVIGCGSNVVDIFHKVESLPLAGEKGYFQKSTEPISAKIVGGVTLNHLCWSRLLGVPTSLLALQGLDENGELIRSVLQNKFDVSTDLISVSDQYCTSLSHIFLDSNGERCIMMAPGSSSQIDKDLVSSTFHNYFDSNTCLFSTEISQIPLSGVNQMLKICKDKGIETIIDVDVPPSVAINQAKLAKSMDEIHECLSICDVIKPTLESAMELLGYDATDVVDINQITKEFKLKYPKSVFCAVTNGKKGAVFADNNDNVINVESLKGINQEDSTGAGDAFFGGIIAGIYHFGMPKDGNDLLRIGNIARCTGAACVEVLGALPLLPKSSDRLVELDGNNAVLRKLINSNPISIDNVIHDPIKNETMNASLQSILSDCQALTTLFNRNETQKSIDKLAQLINEQCQSKDGRIFISGLGKSGIVGTRMAASLSSLSFKSEFVHCSEWMHGDIGKLSANDVIIAFSASGKTRELIDSLKYIKQNKLCNHVIGVFCIDKLDDTHGEFVDDAVLLGNEFEELLDGTLPSKSIILQESFINSVMAQLIDLNKKTIKNTFTMNHPSGNIGQLLKQN